MPQIGPFTRGSTIRIRIQFLDADDLVINPVSSEIHINYPLADGSRGDLESPLVFNDPYWVYEWESIMASPGIVHCYAHSSNPAIPVAAVNFRFQLMSNFANATAKLVDVTDTIVEAVGAAAGTGGT